MCGDGRGARGAPPARVLAVFSPHFRDRNGLEIDLVVSLPDGRWGGVEVKLGSGRIDEAAQNLLRVAGRVDEIRTGKPSFLMVLTGAKFAFRRPDGVIVCPIGCLKP